MPLDLTQLRSITDGNRELEQELFSLFFDTAERCIADMQKLAVSDPHNIWHEPVHELKGAAANIGAMKLSALCREAQPLAPSDPGRGPIASRIHDAYRETKRYILLLEY